MIRELSITRLNLEFQNISHIIFGSQYSFLVSLASVQYGVPIEHARIEFDSARQNYKEIHEGRTFEEWFGFLEANNLVYINENKVFISQYGKDFLKYLIDSNTAYNRVG